MNADRPLAVLIGVGAATGASVCRALARDHRVAVVARSAATIDSLASAHESVRAYPCDVSDEARWRATLGRIEDDHGLPAVVVLNTEGGGMGTYAHVDAGAFAASFGATVTSLLVLAQTWFPRLQEQQARCRVIVNSSPIAFSVKDRYTGLGPARWAQRYLTEALRQSTVDSGIDLTILSIDGAIDEPKMRALLPDRHDDEFIDPNAIGERTRELLELDALELRYDVRPARYTGV